MNTFNCTITERHRPERVVDYTATINMDESCSLICTGFLDVETLEIYMSNIAHHALHATLTFTLPLSHAYP